MKAVEKYLGAYQNAVENYQREHPHWRIEVLVSVIKWSLKSLKHYIEDVRDSEITWESPLVELHYPIDWNWKGRGTGDVSPGGHIFGKFTRRNIATKELAVKTLSQTMTRQFNAMSLAEATNCAWYEKLKNYYTPVLPLHVSTELNAIKNKRQRRACFDELVRPFSIGATRIDASILKLDTGKRVPNRLLESQPQMDIPCIRFTGDINGRKFDIGLVFEIHPLTADYDQKKAYHPVVVGLAVLNAWFVNGQAVQDTPAMWPGSDREKFWEELLAEVEKITVELIPKTEAEDSVILSVNSQIKVPASCWHPEHRSATIKQIADLQSAAGELQGLSVQAAGSGAPQLMKPACLVCGWVHDAGFTQIKTDETEAIVLRGILPEIVALVHAAHGKGLNGLSTKDDTLLDTCGGYHHPCKAFDDLNHRADYKRLFDTSRRGFISLRGAVGRNRNKSETNPE